MVTKWLTLLVINRGRGDKVIHFASHKQRSISTFYKRKIDVQALDPQKASASGKNVVQVIKLKDRLDSDTAKKINKAIKESGIKAQSSIQGDKIRVTDKKRDTLQQVMNFLREQQFGLPLQFNNFKD